MLARYRIGNIMVWLGVLSWMPFIILRIAGQKPSLFWFLPIHLIGVIGGSRLRASARRAMGADAPKRNWLHTLGHALIIAGVLAWVPYFYLKLIAYQSVEVVRFLPFHLTGVLGGLLALLLAYIKNRRAA